MDGTIIEILSMEKKVFTNNEGEFEIKMLTPGNYDIYVQNVGYKSMKTENIKVRSGEQTYLNIPLIKHNIDESFTIKVPSSAGYSFKYYLKIVKSDSTIDYKILEIEPDPSKDYKIIISAPKNENIA